MTNLTQVQGIIQTLDQDDYLAIWIDRFLLDRKIEGCAAGTLQFYRKKLHLLQQYCEARSITQIKQIDADTLRGLLLWLEESEHNAGGRHAVYRAARTFIRWWIREIEPPGYKDPFTRVKAPRLHEEPLEPVSLDTVRALIKTCHTEELTGARDKAILLTLIDTGLRANELLSLALADLDLVLGAAMLKNGKGGKPRTVFFGKHSKTAIKAYLKKRFDNNPALWINQDSEPLGYWGLTAMVKRRAMLAGVEAPGLHDFRRAFAIGMLRSGVDVFTLQRLMGHADLQVLRRYLAQNESDLAAAHRAAGLGDSL